MTHTLLSSKPVNRLAREKSPYLLQHSRNPVDWFPWGVEAFEKARREEKPIFLSIGYSTCHWCHVMERESFETAAVADFLQNHFVSIKLDREERPDVDKIYMTFVQSTTGSGGWPLNVFLTPDLKPFYGGTYFPPDPRHGRPGFIQLLQRIAELWKTRRGEIANSANAVQSQLEQMAEAANHAPAVLLSEEILRNASRALSQGYDPVNGGFGAAPKFPQPSQPSFLLNYSHRFRDEEARLMVLKTCERMAAGGIHDQLGGGFARYSVDAEWLVPHFEKMLYDNAQLALLYLDAYRVSGEEIHVKVARDILDYVLRDMRHPGGGFYSAEDADSEGHEGKFYCWTKTELAELLSKEEMAVASRYFGITDGGNFVDHSHPTPLQGQNVLSVVDSNLSAAELKWLGTAQKKMLRAREKRVRPHLDDKILASWNGLMLAAFARAYAILGEERYLEAATQNLEFIKSHLWEDDSLFHRWREGERDDVQLLSGYAFLLAGVVELYETTTRPAHLEFAVKLAASMIRKFYDEDHGGFWQSPGELSDLIVRVKEEYDGAEPSGNSVATLALLKLAAITDRADFRKCAEATLRLFAIRLKQLPQAVPAMLLALDFWIEEPHRVVIAGNPDTAEFRELIKAAHAVFQPNKVVLGTQGPVEALAKSLPPQSSPAAYVCTANACKPPTRDPAVLKKLLAD